MKSNIEMNRYLSLAAAIIIVTSFHGSSGTANDNAIWLFNPQFDEAWDFTEGMAGIR